MSNIEEAQWFIELGWIEILIAKALNQNVTIEYSPDLSEGVGVGSGINWKESCLDWMHILEHHWEKKCKKKYFDNLLNNQEWKASPGVNSDAMEQAIIE